MGTFLFKWSHPGNEVFVTGSFDDWSKSVQLDKTASGHFEKLVDLPSSEEKVIYKFVVDDDWVTDHTAPTQIDEHGNSNNLLLPEHITKKSTGTLGGAAADLPGAFPATPAVNTENQTFSINPIPATAGIANPVHLQPGEKVPDPSTLTSNTVESTVTTDKAAYEKSDSGPPVLPNPITPDAVREKEGAGMFGLPPISKNMIPESSLPMGEGAVSGLEEDPGVAIRSGGGAPTTAALAGAVPLEPRGVATTEPDKDVTIQSGGGAPTTAALAGEVPLEPRGTATTEPDKDVTIQSGGGAPTTAALAGEVPLEPRGTATTDVDKDVPIQSGGGAPTTAALAGQVPLEPKGEATVEPDDKKPEASGQSVGAKVAEIAGGAAAGATAAVAAAAAFASKAKDNVTSDETKEAVKSQAASAQETAGAAAVQAKETAATTATQAQGAASSAATQVQASALAAAAAVKAKLPESVQQKIDSVLPQASGTGSEPVAPTVPETVKESIAESKQPAEGATNPTQVSNKAAVEEELKEKVEPAEGSGAPAPTITAATSATAPTTVGKSTETPLADGSSAAPVAAGAAGGAAILGKSTETPLNASATAPTTTTAAKPKVQDSRDVSPMTRPDGQSGPVATSGVSTAAVPTSSGPASSGPGINTNVSKTNPAVTAAQQAAKSPTQVPPDSPASVFTEDSAAGSKSTKRRSLFGRIKDKIQHKRSASKSEHASES